ncbi:MAG: serine/threonine-protein kinase PknK [Spirulina sp. SIO3F2]|nr:serine/threonine-protein kinase PknK [Spirulina sp. SIO3F2]
MMLNLTGYQETKLLYTGTRTLVYQAIRLSNDQSVIIKVLRNVHPHFNELVQFRNQYVITRNLNSPCIVKPLTLERYGNGYALVMPDEGAISLQDYWQQQVGYIHAFLAIAIQLANALHYLNQQCIIHKDLKPANILIHPETQQIQLIDFSIASLLPKEQQALVGPNALEGTLAYISPEQTGRMNRGLDYRTDFYSLGVTFYELLTGILPFSLNDPLELVHCHLAQSPIAPIDLLDVRGQPYPAMLSAIIMKLMAKNAEERYQSALGLKYDLQRCLQSLEEIGEIVDFELGERDVCDRFLIPEKLYGREVEVQELLNAFDRVASPRSEVGSRNSELVMVAGFSGIGKTAVVNEVHKPIVEKRGYFIKGKYDQFNRNIPFSAFIQAFRELMGQLVSTSDTELQAWKVKILEAVGANGQVLIDVIPELERVIGQQPQAPELSGAAARNRFNFLFQKFIAVFTTPEHPLVIFLDDLQWADSASLKLIEVLMEENKKEHLLLLGAYRDNEVFTAHPLILTLRKLEKRKGLISTIKLAPLSLLDINQVVAETLSCTAILSQPLTQIIYQQTKGNPFFTTQLLKSLYEEKIITFDLNLGYWTCDLVQVRETTLTYDVVDFMTVQLQKLPQPTQSVLKLAACIGHQFDLATLSIVCENSPESIATDLWVGLQEGILLPLTNAYKFFQDESRDTQTQAETVGYRFLHDRVQQAAYRLIPDNQKQHIHHRIGHLLLNHTDDPQHTIRIFDIVNHLNQAQSLLETDIEQWQLVCLNLQAGQAARDGTAYQAAFDYLAEGLKLLPAQGWQDDYELALTLHREGAIAAVLVGEFDSLEQWAAIALDHTKTLLERIPFYETQIQALVAQKQLPKAIQLGIATLEQLGASFSDTPQPEDFSRGIAAITTLVGDRDVESLLGLPPMHAPQPLAILQVLWRLSSVLLIAAPQLMPFCTFKAVELSIESGNSVLSAPAYVTYGMILCGAVGDIPNGYRFGQLGLQLIEQCQGKALHPKTLVRFNLLG